LKIESILTIPRWNIWGGREVLQGSNIQKGRANTKRKTDLPGSKRHVSRGSDKRQRELSSSQRWGPVGGRKPQALVPGIQTRD